MASEFPYFTSDYFATSYFLGLGCVGPSQEPQGVLVGPLVTQADGSQTFWVYSALRRAYLISFDDELPVLGPVDLPDDPLRIDLPVGLSTVLLLRHHDHVLRAYLQP